MFTGKDFVPVRTAATVVKEFAVPADGREIAHVKNNCLSLVTLPLGVTAKTLTVRWLATCGTARVHLFNADVY